MAAIPNDPVMLMSFFNTKLRDEYDSLTELCRAYDLDEQEIQEKLAGIDYHYNKEKNQFV